ncbi:uncharacterized protein B0T15DRAFT_252660 [Chaetomium strumarium]|uniref:Uncharacterized protein n=1 Tax=Chaetomium strumarium TaxID=1170767 RepID=A0AAJ0GRE2_9PEZI|nr:hypothetical protein B0T15DRAFT_252660 [Chaetomium strumarium]
MRTSYAPLENVSQIRIFYHKGGIHCKGMVLEYNNGGQRAVGECRIMVDHCETFTRPSSIAFVNSGASLYQVKIRVDGPLDDGDEWMHYTMAGTLVFWFSGMKAHMSVEGGFKISHDSQ